MRATVKITPRVAEQVARRLRLAASIRSSSMSRLVNDALDEALPSLEEIRMQLAAPAAGEAGPGLLSDIAARPTPGRWWSPRPAARRSPERRTEGRAMAALAEDHGRRWEPFGVTEADFAAAPERDGVRVVNVTPGGGPGPGQAGWWLRGAAVALGVLAAAAAAVSWDAQYTMVRAVKHVTVVAALEAGIPDVGAVIFAALGVALALHGKRAVRPRALNAACIGISLAMNALAAGHGWRDLAIWVMPAGVYALASDTLIGVVRAWVLARARNQGETLADDGPSTLALVGGMTLWLLRLVLDAPGTLRGFRAWVITDCPVAPGLRPGHVAQLQTVREQADEQITLAICQRDEAAGHAAAQVRQARGEAERARTAEGRPACGA